MDLFTPRFKKDRLHPYFKRLILNKVYKSSIDIILSWAKGMSSRKKEETKFINEFQTTFNSSLWELYLNKAFKELNFEIDYNKESPDFHLIHPSGRIVNVEAVTSNHRLANTKEYYTDEYYKNFINEKDDEQKTESIIKLIGKIKDKRDLFVGKDGKKFPYSSLDHVKNKPFVIAIAPFDNHLSYMQNNTLINQVLYGVLPPEVEDMNNTASKKITHVINNNGKRIDLGIFTNESYKEISAVIFSTTGTFGKVLVQSNLSNAFVRSTRFRIDDLNEYIYKFGHAFGQTKISLSETHDVIVNRMPIDNVVFGSDMHLCDITEHKESHLDGLHIYYNPYAEIPLDDDLFNSYEITQNYYDINTKEMIPIHNDNSLVSRQLFYEEL